MTHEAGHRWRPTRSGVWTATLVFLLSLIVVVPIIWIANLMHGEGELALKPLWSAVQAVDVQERSNSTKGPILRRDVGASRYTVLGIPGVGTALECPCTPPPPTRAWLVLNEHSPSKSIRQLVTFSRYDLDCSVVGGLYQRVPDIDDYVITYLREICR